MEETGVLQPFSWSRRLYFATLQKMNSIAGDFIEIFPKFTIFLVSLFLNFNMLLTTEFVYLKVKRVVNEFFLFFWSFQIYRSVDSYGDETIFSDFEPRLYLVIFNRENGLHMKLWEPATSKNCASLLIPSIVKGHFQT